MKIDAINPSLNTFSFETTLYDLENDKILSAKKFKEGAWATGITQNGYYAVDINKKTAFLFDKSGRQSVVEIIYAEGALNFACAFSYDEKQLAYITLDDNLFHIRNLADKTEVSFCPDIFVKEFLAFENGILTVLGINGETAEINTENFKLQIINDDNRCPYASKYQSFGTTDNCFISSKKGKTVYTPFHDLDELILGVENDAFITTIMSYDKTLIRLYLLKQKKIYNINTPKNIEKAILADDELIALSANRSNGFFSLDRFHYEEYPCDEIDIFDHDAQSVDKAIDFKPKKISDDTTILNVPLICQFPDYPTGCESVSTVMALQYSGENIGVNDFIDKHLPKNNEFYYHKFKKRGPSPYEYFIGSPTSEFSYGCMAPVIETALNDYYGDAAHVKNLTGTALSELCDTYIDNFTPVIVWATINMLDVEKRNSWYIDDETLFTWPGNEHCLLLVGYDAQNYYFNDPYFGQVVGFEKSLVEDRYEKLGKQAIVIT